MKTKDFLKTLTLGIFLFSAPHLFALNANNGQNFTIYENDSFKLGFGLEASYLRGESREMVYFIGDYGWDSKLSELDWDLDDVIMVGGVFSAELQNTYYFNIGSWEKVSNSDGYMDDSDWLYYIIWYTDWYMNGEYQYSTEELQLLRSHFSRSKTALDKGRMFDINAAMTLWRIDGDVITSFFPSKPIESTLTLQGIIGYKYDEWKWIAKGGHYIYEGNYGEFEYKPAVTYEHDLRVPYIGVGANYNRDSFGINTYVLWSKWGESKDTDYHHFRDLKIKGEFDDAEFLGWGVNLKWDIAKYFTISASYQFEDFRKVRGDLIYIDLEEDISELMPYRGGFSHKNETFSLSFAFRFL